MQKAGKRHTVAVEAELGVAGDASCWMAASQDFDWWVAAVDWAPDRWAVAEEFQSCLLMAAE